MPVPSIECKIQYDQVYEEIASSASSLSPEKLVMLQDMLKAMSTAVILMEGMEGDDEHCEAIGMSPKTFYERVRLCFDVAFPRSAAMEGDSIEELDYKVLRGSFQVAHELSWGILTV